MSAESWFKLFRFLKRKRWSNQKKYEELIRRANAREDQRKDDAKTREAS